MNVIVVKERPQVLRYNSLKLGENSFGLFDTKLNWALVSFITIYDCFIRRNKHIVFINKTVTAAADDQNIDWQRRGPCIQSQLATLQLIN